MQFIENTGCSSSKNRARIQGKPPFLCFIVQPKKVNFNLLKMKAPTLSTFLIALTLILWGCSDGDDSLKTTGRLNVFLVDAPFPTDQVAEANVTVFKVEARLADQGSGEDSKAMEDGDSKGGFITLMEDVIGPVNLLELIDGASQQLADAEIPAGTYDLIRVYVNGVNVVMSEEAGGEIYELKVPSGAQSGIKVFLDPPLQVAGGLTEDLVLDFDVSRSFVPKGGSADNPEGISGFNFTPVIRGGNVSTAGSISGTVSRDAADGDPIPVEGATVSLFDMEDAQVTSTLSSELGGYIFEALDPGIYRLEVSLDGYGTQSVDAVEVVVGNDTTQDFVLTSF